MVKNNMKNYTMPNTPDNPARGFIIRDKERLDILIKRVSNALTEANLEMSEIELLLADNEE